jgi:type II secretory pathway pseudopilin PulG
LIELLAVIFIVVVVAAIVLPVSTGGPRKAYMAVCMSNERQITIGLIMFNGDHNGQFPWQLSATNGGSMESILNGRVFPHLREMSEYFAKKASVFVCPTDNARHVATNYSQLLDENISYFLNLDATTNNTAILGGERHLEVNGKAVNPGMFVCSSNAVLNWTRELHGKVQNGPIGGVFFSDGHVQFTRIKDLNSIFRNQPLATNRLCVP